MSTSSFTSHLAHSITMFHIAQDGQIDYGEFAAMMRNGNGGVGRRTMRNTLNLREALGQLVIESNDNL